MSEQPGPERDPSDARPQSPCIKYMTEAGEEIPMKWDNTWIRSYGEGGGMYDHVLIRTGEDGFIAIKPSDDLRQLLIIENYPRIFYPLVDEGALSWYSQAVEQNLHQIDKF